MQTVYVETSIVSFLRARPSAHVVSAARQLITQRWWDKERHQYQLLASQYVIEEASKGNPTFAAQRLAALDDIPLVEVTGEIPSLANRLLNSAVLPSNARLDALHICTAAYHELDYLLTWNCTHIANARILPRIRRILSALGHELPTVCTPEEMIDDEYQLN